MRKTTFLFIAVTWVLGAGMLLAILLFYYRPTIDYAYVEIDWQSVVALITVGSIFAVLVWLWERSRSK